MFSIETILNPAPSGREASSSQQPFKSSPSPSSSSASASAAVFSPLLPVMDLPRMPPMRTTSSSSSSREPSGGLAKTKLRGAIHYQPFEVVGEQALYEIHRFRVTPFGHIKQTCSHIPYNSGKKDFYEKTGRESFEVFRYEFTAPGQSTEYTVMWDYNVGLVRMTPFFKCCQYGKTMPAKMLNLNPGLKEITHSITGGSITAQGYWMPYICAKAVCATFCHDIAGALIPLFGENFPSECVPPDAPEFGRMMIDPQLVVLATREAEIARRVNMSTLGGGGGLGFLPRSDPGVIMAPTSYPPSHAHAHGHAHSHAHGHGHGHHSHDDKHSSFRPRLTCDPSWMADDRDAHYCSGPNSAASSTGSGPHGYMVTSRPGSSWTTAIHSPQYDLHAEPDPYLSAVPKLASLQGQSQSYPGVSSVPAGVSAYWSSMPMPKRRIDHDDYLDHHGYRSSASPTMMGSNSNNNSNNSNNSNNMYRTTPPAARWPGPPSPPKEATTPERREPASSSEAATALVLLGMRQDASPPSPPAPPAHAHASAPAPAPQPATLRLGTSPTPRYRLLPEPWVADAHRNKRQRANSH